MLSFVMLVIGFVLLVWGADKFVEGASALARKMGVSPLLVGLTIVAFGTSMPELAVSVTAALRGANEIAVGNVVGSNMFNLLVVAGLSAVICPLVMDKMLLRRDWPLSIFCGGVLLVAIGAGSCHRALGRRGAAGHLCRHPQPSDQGGAERPCSARSGGGGSGGRGSGNDQIARHDLGQYRARPRLHRARRLSSR